MPAAPRPKLAPAVGLLRPVTEPIVRLSRYHASDELAPFVEHHWIVRWELPAGATREQDTLPHPSVHLVVEEGASGVFGIVRGRFRKTVRGHGRAASVKFRPGGFAAFWPGPVRDLTGRVLSLGEAFGEAGAAYERAVLAAPDDDATLVALAEEFLRARRPHADGALALIARAYALVERDRRIARVADLAGALGVSVRALQRLFGERVGVSPKWVICRARLQEAAARATAGEAVDWGRLAHELGYFDQAHLIRAYRAVIGVPPAEHARRVRPGARG